MKSIESITVERVAKSRVHRSNRFCFAADRSVSSTRSISLAYVLKYLLQICHKHHLTKLRTVFFSPESSFPYKIIFNYCIRQCIISHCNRGRVLFAPFSLSIQHNPINLFLLCFDAVRQKRQRYHTRLILRQSTKVDSRSRRPELTWVKSGIARPLKTSKIIALVVMVVVVVVVSGSSSGSSSSSCCCCCRCSY